MKLFYILYFQFLYLKSHRIVKRIDQNIEQMKMRVKEDDGSFGLYLLDLCANYNKFNDIQQKLDELMKKIKS